MAIEAGSGDKPAQFAAGDEGLFLPLQVEADTWLRTAARMRASVPLGRARLFQAGQQFLHGGTMMLNSRSSLPAK
jgi:hypothetical protein